MISLKMIEQKLIKMMKEPRIQHAYRVSSLAKRIAQYYNIPFEKIEISALIHDCVKDYSLNELKCLLEKYSIQLNNIERRIPKIWHAFAGAEIAKDIFKIEDIEILETIRYHSTASSSFGLMGKIVYIADKIEPNRKFNKIEELRELIWEDIDLTMLELLNYEIKYLFSKRMIIHPYTLEARNKIMIDRGFYYSGKD